MLGCIFYDALSTLHSSPPKLAEPWLVSPQGCHIPGGAILDYKQKNEEAGVHYGLVCLVYLLAVPIIVLCALLLSAN